MLDQATINCSIDKLLNPVQMGEGIQECLSRPYHFKFFKGCLP